MTSYTLLQFPDRLVLVSDDAPIKGEIALLDWEGKGNADDCRIGTVNYIDADRIDMNNQYGNISVCKKRETNGRWENAKWFKVIAGHRSLPSVDVTAIAETIGWVDVKDLAVKFRNLFNRDVVFTYNPHEEYVSDTAYEIAFHKAQELNKNKFTEEDMIEAWESGAKGNALDLMSKQQPKQWHVEVEMEFEDTEGDNYGLRPRITNNTIKVTKVVEQ